jgi:hypothetical protein
MIPPTSPGTRLIREGAIGICPLCHSSIVRKYNSVVSIGNKGCINPNCENYYKLTQLDKDIKKYNL